MITYSDTDLTFYLVTYRDYERAVWCLDLVRITYPNARIVIDVDGDTDPRWRRLRQLHRAEVYYGERLFKLDRGGAIVTRMIDRFLDEPTKRKWLFRIDTDTEIRRPFRELPTADYFGTYRGTIVQGGCIGISRTAAELLRDSSCLHQPELANPITWQRGDSNIAKERIKLGLLSFDWLVAWAMNEINIPAENFTEIRSTWRKPVAAHVDVAVAHPCKKIPVNRPRI